MRALNANGELRMKVGHNPSNNIEMMRLRMEGQKLITNQVTMKGKEILALVVKGSPLPCTPLTGRSPNDQSLVSRLCRMEVSHLSSECRTANSENYQIGRPEDGAKGAYRASMIRSSE